MKLHRFRPLPPPDRRRRPLWGFGWRRGWPPAWEQAPSPPFHCHAWRGSAPAPVAVPSAAPHGRLGEQLPPPLFRAARRRGVGNPQRLTGRTAGARTFPGSRWRRKEDTERALTAVPRKGAHPGTSSPLGWPEAVGRAQRGLSNPAAALRPGSPVFFPVSA